MPNPTKGETKEEYISRFMSSPEARKDYPDEKQRAAVAYSMWEKKNIGNAVEAARSIKMRFIEPGLVSYGEQGTVLVQKPALDRMLNSMVGKPIYNFMHKEASASHFKEGKADGIVTNAWYNSEDGWYWLDALIWDEATIRNAQSGVYFPSCAYTIEGSTESGGVHNNIAYDQEITDGLYTHVAIVPNPRYEEALIVFNSKGGLDQMKLMFWKKEKDPAGKEIMNSVELPAETQIDVDGKKVSLKELVNAVNPASSITLSDDSVIDVDGKPTTIGALKKQFKNAADDREDKSLKEEEKEKKNAEEEKKKKEDEEKKNADEKAKKEEEEKKNAEDAEKKKEDEKKNALEAEKKKKAFEDLQNAANHRGDAQPAPINFSSRREKAKSAELAYGSSKK